MFHKEEKCILIVGAGPVGMSLAIMLKQMDIPFRIVEKRVEKTVYSRATGIQARTLEVFKQMKVLDAIKSRGTIGNTGLEFYYDGKKTSRIEFNSIESSEPFTLGLYQSETEEILAKRLEELGVKIEFGTEVTSLNFDGEDVDCVDTIRSNGETERIATDFLVGCDGGHSKVRKLSNILFSGEESMLNMTLMDLVMEIDLPKDISQYAFFHNNQSMLMDWMDETKVRISIPDMSGKKPPTLEEALEIVKNNTAPHETNIKRVDWFTNIKINDRKADLHCRDNIYLCGDAAHSHSPAGAQGMNTGIQDAYNLAWKLAYIHKGLGIPAKLSQTYHQERSAVAEKVVKSTHTLTKMLTNSDIFNKLFLTYVAPALMTFEYLKSGLSNFGAQVSIKYDQNDLIRDTTTGLLYNSLIPGVGMRLPPYSLMDVQSNSKKNIHDVINGGLCFEFILYIPELYFDNSAVHIKSNLNKLINSPTLLRFKELAEDQNPLFKINVIFSTKISPTDQLNNHINNLCATEMKHQLDQTNNFLDRDNQIGTYFQFVSNQMSLAIVRPDAVVGLSAPINSGNCQKVVESYFSRFISDAYCLRM